MEGHHDRADMMSARDLVRHHPAVHHVNCLGLELGDGPVDFAPQPIVRRGSLGPAIDEQNADVQADGAQAPDLFLHKDAPARERRRRVNICDGQDSHSEGRWKLLIRARPGPRRGGRIPLIQALNSNDCHFFCLWPHPPCAPLPSGVGWIPMVPVGAGIPAQRISRSL